MADEALDDLDASVRRTDPDRPRAFRCPAPWVVGPAAIFGCLYLFFSLQTFTQLFFLGWNVAGVLVYLAYARGHSVVGRAA